MKNIHIIPTEKPSRLVRFFTNKYHLCKDILPIQDEEKYVNIYITSDSEIKEGDWYIADNKVYRAILDHNNPLTKDSCKKIILTTDPELINDNVQAIDDEFLEWFVKKPNHESVEVQKWFDGVDFLEYKIIIPQEEPKQECEHIKEYGCIKDICTCNTGPKQETLEEAAKKYCLINNIPTTQMIVKTNRSCEFETPVTMFLKGAEHQAEKMYSEEDVKEIIKIAQSTKNYGDYKPFTFNEIIQQFKKK